MITSDLIEGYQDALDILDDSVVTCRILLKAHRLGRRLPDTVIAKLQQQCTAAAVTTKRLRKKLARFVEKRSAAET
ncbi:MAG TPA: hypothetical protein VEK56_18880 [Vicinamibacterales bacterium]|nr:hypothetical protein [Vicinamibacterales bacterium]